MRDLFLVHAQDTEGCWRREIYSRRQCSSKKRVHALHVHLTIIELYGADFTIVLSGSAN